MRLCVRLLLLLLSLSLFSAPVALAQFSAAVQGTVTDNTGASVPQATVTLINKANNVRQTATTDSSGVYRFVSLQPGAYTVQAASTGFSLSNVNFTLQTAENRDVPIQLQLGSVTTSVEVTSQAPLLDTSDSRLQYTLDTKALGDLPLSTRNPTALIGVTPGVTGALDAQNNLNNAPENFIDAGANGRGENGNEYVVDGLDVTSNVRPGVVNLTPGADTIQEVSVQTNTYTVEYGRGSGIQTILTTKSGTDQFHGFASEYFTYQGFQARGEYGPTHAAEASLPPFHINNAAFGVGGPIWKSKKLFFFVNYQPYHSGGANFLPTYFEDPAFVSFAQAARPNSPELQLFKYPVDSATGVHVYQTAADIFGTGCGTAATDNIPCTTPVLDTGSYNNRGVSNAKQYGGRIDKYFSKDRLYGDVIRNTYTTATPNPRSSFNTTNDYYGFAFQVNETHTFSPNLLNEGIFAFNRIEGIQPSQGLFNVPIVSVNGNFAGFGDGFAQGDYYQHSYHWRDVVTYIHGSHSFRFGYEGWHGDDTAIFQGPHGQAAFNYTSLINLINDNPYSETGLSYNFQSGQPQPGNYGYSETTAGAFAQDTWKIKRLTLNYGIRYDNYGNPYPSLAGSIAAPFNLGTGSNLQQQIANGYLKAQPRILNQSINWNFSPRAGASWDVTGDGKWVVQAGFGVYHDQITLGNLADIVNSNPPNYVVPTFFNDGSTAAPIFSFGTQNSYPYGFTYPNYSGGQLDSHGGVAGAQIGIGSPDVNVHSPTDENWSLAVEHSISQAVVGSLAYVGSHDGGILLAGLNQGGNAFGYDVNAFPGDLIEHTTCKADGSCSAFRTRLNPSFGAITYEYNTARSNYSALIASMRARFGRNAFFTASYTRSIAQDDASIYAPTASFDQNRFYGNSPYDVPNRFSFGGSYNTPNFHINNAFLERAAAGWTLGGTVTLQSGTPLFISTNAPYSVESINNNLQYTAGSGDFSGSGYNYDLPDIVSNEGNSTSRQAYKTGIFPATCRNFGAGCPFFAVPGFGQLGNEHVTDQFRNPGFAQTDVSLHKNTQIYERLNLDLRLDAFNLFNRVNFYPLDGNAPDGSFGTASNGYHTPRYLQVGGTFNF